MQQYLEEQNIRMIILFEGRDASGKECGLLLSARCGARLYG